MAALGLTSAKSSLSSAKFGPRRVAEQFSWNFEQCSECVFNKTLNQTATMLSRRIYRRPWSSLANEAEAFQSSGELEIRYFAGLPKLAGACEASTLTMQSAEWSPTKHEQSTLGCLYCGFARSAPDILASRKSGYGFVAGSVSSARGRPTRVCGGRLTFPSQRTPYLYVYADAGSAPHEDTPAGGC